MDMSENKENNNENYVKPPSFLQMVKTFTTEIATYIANGSPNVTTEDYITRLDTCNKCDHFIEKSMRCGKCGCLMEHKAKMKTSDCPIGKWEKQTLTPEQKETFEKHEERREKARDEDDKMPLNVPIETFIADTDTGYIEYTPEEFKKLKEENAKRQKDNNTDSSNKV